MATGAGAIMTDADGREIVDFWFNASSLPLGHADPRVSEAVAARARAGSAFYAPTECELTLAEMICERLASADRIRFTNSGSEAVMMAVRLARARTGRDVVIKCEGSYHGSYDDAQWSVSPDPQSFGDADAPTPVPDSGGLPSGKGRIKVVPYNDAGALRRTVATDGSEIAAVLIEPMANRIGLILPSTEFLRAAREACDACGAILIFDEVIAFRLGYNGAQGTVGVTPDATTLGKVIGGGFPVGAVAGRADVMATSDPGAKGRVTHAGTFNANPVTVAAGAATMEALSPEVFETINAEGMRIRARLSGICEGLPLRITGAGSVFKINATGVDISDYRSAITVDNRWEELVSLELFADGFMVTPHLHGCVSTVTTEEHVEGFLDAFARIVRA
jgi:glutamate-1-semialdehyde 2,1-aminomutase